MKKALLDSNLWISLAPSSLVYFFRPEASVDTLGFVFFGTLFLYNFARINRIPFYFLDDVVENIHKFTAGMGLLGAGYFGIHLQSPHFFICLFLFGIPSILYSLPLQNMGLRFVPFVKIFVISFVWAGMVWVFPGEEIVKNLFSETFLIVFFFTIGITLPFDIRDAATDSKTLKTLPQLIGNRHVQYVAAFALFASSLLFFFTYGWDLRSTYWALTCAMGVAFVGYAPRYLTSRWYFEGFGEGIALLPTLLLILLEYV